MEFLGSLALVAAQLMAVAPATQNTRSPTPVPTHDPQTVSVVEATREPAVAQGRGMATTSDFPPYAERIAAARHRNAVNADLNRSGDLPRGGNNQ